MEFDEPIDVRDYDPDWSGQFESEGIRLLEAIGETVREIEHVGSTAVEGLAAVPVIDIAIGVDALEAFARHVPALQELGYEYFGEAGVADRLYLRKRGLRKRGGVDCDLYVVVHHGEHWRSFLHLRDYLRAHPERAAEYGDYKRQLVERDGHEGLESYVDAKADFVRELLDEANDWRE